MIKLKCIGLDILNPGCNPILEHFYISFEAQGYGFVNGCRCFIGIDACFLKGPFKGQLLVVVSLDANSGIFPLAVMIANREDGLTWEYFLDCLSNSVGAIGGITFMSDRQKGLKNAVKKVFPMENHRFCARHLYNNFKVKNPGPKLKQLFWAAVKAYNEQDFLQVMDEMKEISRSAYNWLLYDGKEPLGSWERYKFDEHVRNDHVTNNMTESFNAFVVKVRENPVLTLLEWIRRKTMTRFQQRYEKAVALATPIPSKARERINRNQKEGKKLLCFRGSDHLFEVNDSKNYVVNLQEMSCQCREWPISGVLCKHALCCMTHIRDDPTRFVHPLLTRDFYVKTYSKTINPVPDESKWPAVDHPVGCPREDIEKQRGTAYDFENLKHLMFEIGNVRDSLRLMPDFQRREMAANLAMKMAAMFGDSSGDEGGFD
ncbi:uncharacterized protein LOC132053802 [Lycium ferocissimum]|uniref:uncharacterized protein LOC132053802 n=1 Tax=Lycium ferocissimum TaxID=112874 RepID=UPI0028159961|nr:uncharacterized protein LOC132053802 [Lycium ferocissimum]